MPQHSVPRVFLAIVIVLAAAAATGGVPLGWYRRFAWYDDLMYDVIGATLAALWLALGIGS